MTFLSLAELLQIHQDQIARYGGAPGTRDLDLLKSAAGMPSATCEGRFLHADLFEMAAAYLFHSVQNHPFVDGNKLTGAAAALVFLLLNGYEFRTRPGVLSDFVMAVAAGKKSKADAAVFLRNHSRKQ